MRVRSAYEAELRAAQAQATTAARRAAETAIAVNRVQQEQASANLDGHSMSPIEGEPIPSSQETVESAESSDESLPELEGDQPQSGMPTLTNEAQHSEAPVPDETSHADLPQTNHPSTSTITPDISPTSQALPQPQHEEID